MAHGMFSMCSALCVIFLCASWGVEAGHDNSHKRLTPAITSPPRENSTVLECPTPKSKFIVKLAVFSPASEQFCELSNCTSKSKCKICILGKSGLTQVCKEKFGSTDVWDLYQGCGSSVDKGMPCGDVISLSQRRYEVKYDCLEETSRIDPCQHGVTGLTEHIYHDLSSVGNQRQCTCTGSVQGLAEARDNYVGVHVSYLVMLDPRQKPLRHQNIVNATIVSKNGTKQPKAGTFPGFFFVNVSRQTPSISVTLRVGDWTSVSGFVWFHFQDVTVNLTCTSSGGVTDMSRPGEKTTTTTTSGLLTTPSPGADWLTTGALVGAAGVIVITVVASCALLRRRRRRRQQRETQPLPSANEGEPSPSPSPHYTYTEVSPNHLQTSCHRHHDVSPSNDREPARHNAGNDVGDYATLQHHVGQRVASPGRGSNDTYDHALRLGGEYQALDRGVRRQQVIDHDYDSTDRLL